MRQQQIIGLAIAAVVLVLCCRPMQAAPLDSYDLDSLVFKSSAIGQGEITSNKSGILQFRVSAVLMGDSKPGTTIPLSDTGSFCVAGTGGRRTLTTGDKLFVFLSNTNEYDPKQAPVDLHITSSGLKWIVDDKVCDFYQFGNPGPYYAESPTPETKHLFQNSADFSQAVKASMTRVEVWKKQWKDPATPTEAQQLLDLLRDRKELSYGQGRADAISQTAGLRLIALNDPNLICKAIEVNPYQTWVLFRGFQTPAGRDLLLSKLAEPSTPKQMQMQLASALYDAGYVHGYRITEVTLHSSKSAGGIEPGNAGYLRRFAKVIAGSNDEQVRSILLSSFEEQATDFRSSRNVGIEEPDVQADMDQAAVVLRDYYKGDSSEITRYGIERITSAIGQEAFAKLGSKGGPLSAVVELADSSYGPVEPGTIRVKCEFQWHDAKAKATAIRVRLLAVDDAKVFYTPGGAAVVKEPRDGGSCVENLPLPKDLPHGRYRITYQIMNDASVVGESHGFVAKL